MSKDSLGDRMKGYENAYRVHIPKRLPIIIRVDGRAFHTLTRGFERPFDEVLRTAMQLTAKKLCEEVAGCKLAYVQSDEISLLVTNDDSIETQPWFSNSMWKLVSLTASIATLEFNNVFTDAAIDWTKKNSSDWYEGCLFYNVGPESIDRMRAYGRAMETATFDSRAFVMPKDEVVNYFIWRQQDATRNSIQMVAQSLYSHKQLQGKNSSDLQEMIHQKGINWNDYLVPCKRGTCVVKGKHEVGGVLRHRWEIDENIPVFTADRQYIEGRMICDSCDS